MKRAWLTSEEFDRQARSTPLNQMWRLFKPILLLQLVLLFMVCIVCVFFGLREVISALIGGVVFLLPNSVFFWFTMRFQGAQSAGKIVSSFYRGEALKLIGTAILLAIALRFSHALGNALALTPFFVAFVSLVMGNGFAPLVLKNRHL